MIADIRRLQDIETQDIVIEAGDDNNYLLLFFKFKSTWSL